MRYEPNRRKQRKRPERAIDRGSAAGLSDRRERTRLRLIHAAAEVFATHGIPKATVEDILEKAGLSRRTFYQFFNDKLDLVGVVYALSMEHFVTLIREVVAEAATGVEAILDGIDLYLRFQATSGPLVRTLASEALRPGSPANTLRQGTIDRLVNLYCEKFDEVHGRQIDPLMLRALILAAEAMGLSVLAVTGSDEDVERVRRVLHELVQRGIGQEPRQPRRVAGR